MQFQIASTLSPAECVVQLKPLIGREAITKIGNLMGSTPMVGEITGHVLFFSKRSPFNDFFRPQLSATLHPEASGTSITGEISLDSTAEAFRLIISTLAVVIALTLIVAALYHRISGTGDGREILGLILPFAMIVLTRMMKNMPLPPAEVSTLLNFLVQNVNGKLIAP